MRRALLLPAVLVVVLASACSSLTAAPAATVEGTRIDAESLRDELKAIRGNTPYREQIEQGLADPTDIDPPRLQGAGAGTFGTELTARVLSIRVYVEALDHALREKNVRIGERQIRAAQDAVKEQLGDEIYEGFPAEYRKQLQRQEAVLAGTYELIEREREIPLTQAAFNQYLNEVTCAADVDVNPSFGRWDRQGCRSGDAVPRVAPPEGPSTTTGAGTGP